MKMFASVSGARAVLPPPGVGGDFNSSSYLTPSSQSSTDRMFNLLSCLRKNSFPWKLLDSLGGTRLWNGVWFLNY